MSTADASADSSLGTSADSSAGRLPLDELRARRRELQGLDDAVSFVRRLAQARLDLVRACEHRLAIGDAGVGRHNDPHHADPHHEMDTAGLVDVLATHLTGGAARPPRPVEDFSGHPLAIELTELEQRYEGAGIDALDAPALAAFADALEQFERVRSAERRDVFAQVDALSAELVRRYRSGEADVDALLAAD